MSLTGGSLFFQNFRKTDGTPYTSTRTYHYEPGGTTDKAAYSDEALTTTVAQPFVGDSNGWVKLYLDGAYRLLIKSSVADGDLTLFDLDPIRAVAKSATLRAENQATSYPSATSANRGLLFAKIDGSGNVTEVGVNKAGSSFAALQFSGETITTTQYWAQGADLASASTLTLGTDGNFFDVTGTTAITAISAMTAGTVIGLQFDGSLTLTYNVTSLILPGRANITTQAGDIAYFISRSSGGNWQCFSYVPVNGRQVFEVKGADLASAATVDLSTATGQFVDITGTTTITALGTLPAGVERTVRFTGALTLTHNGTSLILPGAANITTANGDTAIFRSLGSGNWLCISYLKIATQAEMEAGAALASIVTPGRQQYHPSAAKAWISYNFPATVPTLQQAYNFSATITDNGVGDATLNLSVTMSTSTWCAVGMVEGGANVCAASITSRNTTQLRIYTTVAGAASDSPTCVAVFGDI